MARTLRSDKIKLEDVPTLTFYKDKKTKARRKKAIQQLTCEGAPCRDYTPDVVQCANVGGDPPDWACHAELPTNTRMGRVEVSCESWTDDLSDPYVLKGSCGLHYRLVPLNDRAHGPSSSSWTHNPVALASIALALFLLYRAWRTAQDAPDRGNRPGGGGPGNGPPWNPFNRPDDDAPPPYPGKFGQQGQARQQGPGFWTGLGAGALGGMAAQRFMTGGQQRQFQPQQQRHREEPRAGPSTGEMRTSTGYGSTRNR